MQELKAACVDLGRVPNAFEILQQSSFLDIRRRIFTPYIIFYRITEREIDAVRIIHGARDYLRILGAK